MELWHNQVTRVQGPFSLRMFHRSWGLMLIQANIEARCTVLDFPTQDRFIEEIRDNQYDIIGISAIIPNTAKVARMCELIREYQPNAKIVIGGHISNVADIRKKVAVDHVVRGDGVRRFREYLGQDTDEPIIHQQIWSGLGKRCMGMDLPLDPHTASAALIPSVGCPLGCNFCSTSAMFGGKGHCVDFFQTAEELFAVMCQLEEAMKTCSFFVMDENFLLRKKRALRLLELMQEHDKAWALYVFSSANAIRQYTFEQLVGLGVSWLWMGLEGKDSQYNKLNETDTHHLVRQLQDHGIRVLGSSIVGLEEHTPENFDEAIEHAVSHDTDFHQFMLYTPVPGTPLHKQHEADGSMLEESEYDAADIHGQLQFNFRHANIPAGQEGEMLLRAFEADYRTNGPSTIRIVRTVLKGWQRYKNHPDARIRRRFAFEAEGLWSISAGTVWAARKYFRENPVVFGKLDSLLKDLYAEFGLKTRLVAPLIGRYVLGKIRKEDKRLAEGWTYEPQTHYERNYQADGQAKPATILQTVPGLTGQKAAAKT